jgi:putative PIN family toxin of toxin-antitoxin system
MKPPRVVFDTNIYIQKLLSPGGGGDKLFGLFVNRKLDLYTSKKQLEELVGVVLATMKRVDGILMKVTCLRLLPNYKNGQHLYLPNVKQTVT